MTMVRDDRWKYVEFVDSDEGQLFDLDVDPLEEHTLWDAPADSEAGQAKCRLREVINRWRARSALHTADFGRAYR
jgi:arylsulfatase A-like enzyme